MWNLLKEDQMIKGITSDGKKKERKLKLKKKIETGRIGKNKNNSELGKKVKIKSDLLLFGYC